MISLGAALAGGLLAAQFVGLAALAYGSRKMRKLPAYPPDLPRWPALSVVLAARDEEAELEGALRTLLATDYPGLEVVAVDDRSADRTPAILARLAEGEPRLSVVRVDELPEGWLGKNYALHRGASRATGELLLFTDADVSFGPEALRKTVAVLQAEGLDHLAVAPLVRSPSLAVNLAVTCFAQGFGLMTRPWKVRDPRSKAHIGLGAFNLVRRSSYEAVGGHEPIRLRPDDDLKLGKLFKRAGFAQECMSGQEDLRLAWYPTVGAFVRGLEKNVLAGLDYSLPAFLAGVLAIWAGNLGPWLLLAFGDPTARVLAAGTILTSMVGYAGALRMMGLPAAFAPANPFAQALMGWTVLRSGALAYLRGGIIWRGTFYPLAALVANRVDWAAEEFSP
jgi:hypothetical protein